MDLFGRAHFLIAALNLKQMEQAKNIADNILSHSSQSGGKFSFNESLLGNDDSYKRILHTPLRTNCAILSAFSQMAKSSLGKEQVGDTPFRIVRGITQSHGQREHFQSTQENLFCMNALIDYSRIYESVKPNMKVSVQYRKKSMGKGQLKGFKAKPLKFVHPLEKEDIGQARKLSIQRKGKGRLYHATYVRYAPLDKFSIRHNAGIDIRKEIRVKRDEVFHLLKDGDRIKRGKLCELIFSPHCPRPEILLL